MPRLQAESGSSQPPGGRGEAWGPNRPKSSPVAACVLLRLHAATSGQGPGTQTRVWRLHPHREQRADPSLALEPASSARALPACATAPAPTARAGWYFQLVGRGLLSPRLATAGEEQPKPWATRGHSWVPVNVDCFEVYVFLF